MLADTRPYWTHFRITFADAGSIRNRSQSCQPENRRQAVSARTPEQPLKCVVVMIEGPTVARVAVISEDEFIGHGLEGVFVLLKEEERDGG